MPVRNLGYLPAFNPSNLSAMGQYTIPTRRTSRSAAINTPTSRTIVVRSPRHVQPALRLQPNSSHTLKAGAGFEFGEELLNRIANGWGTIADITQSGVPALRTRYFTPQPPQLGQGRTYSIFAQDDVSIGKRTSVNVGILLNRDDFSRT